MPHHADFGKKHVNWNREPKYVDLKKHPLGSRSRGGRRKAGEDVQDMTPNERKKYEYYGKKLRRERERLGVSVKTVQVLDARMGRSATMAAGYSRSHDQQAISERQGLCNQAYGNPKSVDSHDERHYNDSAGFEGTDVFYREPSAALDPEAAVFETSFTV